MKIAAHRTISASVLVVSTLFACGGANAGPEPNAPAGGGSSPSSASSYGHGGPPSGKTESTSGPVGSVQEEEFYTRLNKELADWLQGANEACGTKITGSYDTSWRGHWTETYPSGYGANTTSRDACNHVVSQVKMVCTDGKTAAAKKAVASKIQKVVCAYGGPGKMIAELKNGTITGSIDPDGVATDLATATGNHLRSKL